MGSLYSAKVMGLDPWIVSSVPSASGSVCLGEVEKIEMSLAKAFRNFGKECLFLPLHGL